VSDHYDLYGHLYGFAVARAAQRRSPEMLDRLASLQKQIRDARDPQTAWRLNRAFHGTVLDMARSPRIGAVVRALAGIVPGNFFELVPGSMEVEKTGTAAILRALRRGDAYRAAEAYARMMRRQGDLVVDLFQSRGILPTSRETMVAR
jgi:DNA-binding GntR family transcriptional regulator